MPKSNKRLKPIVGEDGELLEADTNIDMAVYYDSIADPYPPPTLLERIRYSASNNPVIWIVVLVILGAIAIAIMPAVSPPKNPPFLSNYSGLIPTSIFNPNLAASGDESAIFPAKGLSSVLFRLPAISQIRWSPNKQYLALQIGLNRIAVWDIRANGFSYYGTDMESKFDWSPDSQYLYLNHYQIQDGHLFPLFTAKTISNLTIKSRLHDLSQPPFLTNGVPKLMVTSPTNKIAVLSADGLSVSVVDPTQLDWMFTSKLDNPAHDLDWIGNGNWFSVVTDDGVWKWFRNIPILLLGGQYQQVSWSPDSQSMAITQDLKRSGLHEPTITMMNPDHPNERWSNPLAVNTLSIKDAADFNVQVKWSPDGKRIATFIQRDTSIALWDAVTGVQISHFENPTTVISIDWSPDGANLAISSNSDVTIWSP
ncbi:MAG: hypothetical protein H0X30_03980 [Anaerolineae bacterium]|nr:hypothetical protein [Anaerolineae bacterium]